MLITSQSELSMPCWQQGLSNVPSLDVEVLYPLLCCRLHSHRHAGRGRACGHFVVSATTLHYYPAALPGSQHRTTHALQTHMRDTSPLLLLQQTTPTCSLMTADPF